MIMSPTTIDRADCIKIRNMCMDIVYLVFVIVHLIIAHVLMSFCGPWRNSGSVFAYCIDEYCEVVVGRHGFLPDDCIAGRVYINIPIKLCGDVFSGHDRDRRRVEPQCNCTEEDLLN